MTSYGKCKSLNACTLFIVMEPSFCNSYLYCANLGRNSSMFKSLSMHAQLPYDIKIYKQK